MKNCALKLVNEIILLLILLNDSLMFKSYDIEELVQRVKKEWNLTYNKNKKGNWIGHNWSRNCLLNMGLKGM